MRLTQVVKYLSVIMLAGFGCAGSERTSTSEDDLTSCVNLPASADARLSHAEMHKNFGVKKVLLAGERNESLLRFDLGSIPAAAAIDSATLKLYVSDADTNKPVNVHRATAAWAESTVTFASFAQHFDPHVVGQVIVHHENVQKSVDLTALTTSWLTGANVNYGVVLESPAREETTFVSREGGTAEQKPTLRVCYTTPDDHCAPNPCANGATCENTADAYVCHCTPGYTGATCETNINDCASNPCQNQGTCSDGIDSYTCTCAAGFTGANCETNIDDCSPDPCQNGGVCEDGTAAYTCHCPAGYSGANCETLIDNCLAGPCQNGGTCTSGVDSYTCECAIGFTGANCEINIDDCASSPCQNGGTCVDRINAYTCACPPDWGGDVCEVNLNECAQTPCLNGTCTNGFGNYTCACFAGFTGANCEIDINDCAVNPCQNDGICVDGINSHTCTCQAGFSGANCETNIDDCAGNPCQNGGLCDDGINSHTCSCSGGFSGANCETLPPKTCREILADNPNASLADGAYTIYPSGAPVQVYCDMHTDGGGWTSLFIGANGSTNVFDHFDHGVYTGAFNDPSSGRYLQHAPGLLGESASEIGVSCGSAMVKFAATSQVTSFLSSGTQAGWVPITTTTIAGSVANVPNTLWTGNGDTSFILAKNQSSGGNVFASSYSGLDFFDYCNGQFDQASVVRIFYREAAPTAVKNTPQTAGASCESLLNAGQSQGDGVYWLVQGTSSPYQAYCDMTTDGGGWTAVFAGRNGSTNVFDHFDAGYTESCTDPASHCLRHAPSTLADTAADVAVSCGGAMVKLASTSQVTAFLSSGTQAGWVRITPTTIGGSVANAPNWLYTGTGGDTSFIFAKNQDGGANTFASSVSGNTAYDSCNGQFDQASLVRVFYREAAPTAVKNTPQTADASCAALLNAGQSQGDGIYWLVQGTSSPYQAYCDMTTDGGGWTAVFAGRNGSPNVFDHFDAGYTESCTDPASHCLRHAPSTLGDTADVAVSCGGAMVKFASSSDITAFLSSGTQASWVPIAPTPIAGSIANAPNFLFTGDGSGPSFVFAKDQGGGGNTFASSFSANNGYDDCNGVFDQASLVRIFYR